MQQHHLEYEPRKRRQASFGSRAFTAFTAAAALSVLVTISCCLAQDFRLGKPVAGIIGKDEFRYGVFINPVEGISFDEVAGLGLPLPMAWAFWYGIRRSRNAA